MAIVVILPALLGLLVTYFVAKLLSSRQVYLMVVILSFVGVIFAFKELLRYDACGFEMLRQILFPDAKDCYADQVLGNFILIYFVLPSFILGLVFGAYFRLRKKHSH